MPKISIDALFKRIYFGFPCSISHSMISAKWQIHNSIEREKRAYHSDVTLKWTKIKSVYNHFSASFFLLLLLLIHYYYYHLFVGSFDDLFFYAYKQHHHLSACVCVCVYLELSAELARRKFMIDSNINNHLLVVVVVWMFQVYEASSCCCCCHTYVVRERAWLIWWKEARQKPMEKGKRL